LCLTAVASRPLLFLDEVSHIVGVALKAVTAWLELRLQKLIRLKKSFVSLIQVIPVTDSVN